MKKELKSGNLSADKSADHRPINRPTVGRLSVGLMQSRFIEANYSYFKIKDSHHGQIGICTKDDNLGNKINY